MSARENVLQAIVAALTTVTPSVYRSRVVALTRGELPAVVVTPESEDTEQLARALTSRQLTIKVAIHARGDIPDQAVDTLAGNLHAALLADDTLGGKCARIVESGTSWEFSDADGTALEMTISYTATYSTPTNKI